VRALREKLGDDYSAERDRSGTLPSELHETFARGGWLAIAMA